MATTVSHRPTRRVVVRRSAVDKSWDTLLAELPTEIRPAARKYFETNQAAYAARYALSTELTRHGLRWAAIDRLAGSLS